jgi:hypothetical protein
VGKTREQRRARSLIRNSVLWETTENYGRDSSLMSNNKIVGETRNCDICRELWERWDCGREENHREKNRESGEATNNYGMQEYHGKEERNK